MKKRPGTAAIMAFTVELATQKFYSRRNRTSITAEPHISKWKLLFLGQFLFISIQFSEHIQKHSRGPQTCFRACFLSNPKFLSVAKRFLPQRLFVIMMSFAKKAPRIFKFKWSALVHSARHLKRFLIWPIGLG